MRAVLLTLAAVCGFTALTSTATAAPAADPRAKLDTAIDEGIRLLEDEEYIKFVKMFVPPDELKKITEKRSIEEFAEGFGEKNAPRLKKVLKSIKGSEPTIDDDGKMATYELKEAVGSKKTISFVKIDKLWYLKN